MKILWALVALLVMTPSVAQAYLDPGSGSLIFQAVAAVLAGVLVALRTYLHRIKSYFDKSAAESSDGELNEDRSVDDARDE